jgi:predicted nucleotidyltransferase
MGFGVDVRSATASTTDKIDLERVTPELLQEVVRRIVAAVDPDKIILFGSHACGTPHEWGSDSLRH